ncbi:penicillin-binding protein 1A [Oceanidesulfovibrio marinus]|uniref:Penicillin-binding protein 1A n=1 Tax=Oceanidesulfovibrio marinus TaxID=370038 RepID=A0A6P1ZC20_9BACT|nr:PBP1A family penicillin-binding protein [Oceanidesulfovibrio marinus]QJT10926.1 PBP1A family penicillin-binding protein [Oceanidesulfovibrio marinus]TVM30839.1 penicillin-binding protein [Oceanidesulfovibrio marinus]
MKKKILIGIAIGLLGLITIAAAGGLGLYLWAARDLPSFKKITDYNPPLVTTVYARNGDVLGHFYRERRFLVRLEEMPDYLVKAFLAAEDRGFYEHPGIDPSAIFRAMVKNFLAGDIRQGGSTITQQIIKRLLLTPEKSYERKLKEAILAYRLESYLSKDDIITIYLNQIYLGARSYGVEAAARSYFGKHVGELSLAEAAVLAGLPQAPSRYDPYRHPERAKQRQRYVLEQMLDAGWITQDQFDEAVNAPLEYSAMPDPSWQVGAYYLEEVRRWLIDYMSRENMNAMGATLDRYGEDAVYESGLHVYTAIDLDHQRAAEKALHDGLIASTKRRGWRGPIKTLAPSAMEDFLARQKDVVQRLASGEWVEAVVKEVSATGATVELGNFEGWIPVKSMHWCRKPDPKKATEQVPSVSDARKVLSIGDVVWVSRASGDDKGKKSKATPEEGQIPLELEQEPEVQGALVSLEPPTGEVRALVGGYDFQKSNFNRATQAHRQPGSAFKPIVYSAAIDAGFTPASIIIDAPTEYRFGGRVWRPSNFEGEYYGPTLLRTALVKSRNTVTVRIAERMGVDAIIDRAHALGIEEEFPRNLTISLGSVAVTPYNLCEAYTAFAREGTVIKPRMVLAVKGAWGDDLYQSAPEVREAISPQNAYIMDTLLQDVVQHGTGWRAKVLDRPVAGKTGTTNEEHDAWFMGFTPYLLTGVYVGFDQLTPMGRFETGSRAASPIWVQYRQAVEDTYQPEEFPVPPDIVHVNIDLKTGKVADGSSNDTEFLPFIAGSQPSAAVAGYMSPGANGTAGDAGPSSPEDLFKQF